LAAAQETHLPALKEIGDGGCGFTGVTAATGNGENKVAEGKLGTLGFAHVLFHKNWLRLWFGTRTLLAIDVPLMNRLLI
jgi:hypothetical protein